MIVLHDTHYLRVIDAGMRTITSDASSWAVAVEPPKKPDAPDAVGELEWGRTEEGRAVLKIWFAHGVTPAQQVYVGVWALFFLAAMVLGQDAAWDSIAEHLAMGPVPGVVRDVRRRIGDQELGPISRQGAAVVGNPFAPARKLDPTLN